MKCFLKPRVLSKAIFGPVLDLFGPCPLLDLCFGRQRLGRRFFPLVAFPVRDGESPFAAFVAVVVEPGQEVRGNVLGFDPRAGAHLGFASLVEGHEPLAAGPAVPVERRGVRVVAVLLETLAELAVVRK